MGPASRISRRYWPAGHIRGEHERSYAERRARCQARLIGRRTVLGWRPMRVAVDGRRNGSGRIERGARRRTQHALAFDRYLQCALGVSSFHERKPAVVDRFQEPAAHAAAREPVAIPATHHVMTGVGVDLDAGHKPSREAEHSRDLIVVDLVLRDAWERL